MSSFHLWWQGWAEPGPLASVAATLEVFEPPSVDRLYFWALQATFSDGARSWGGAHTGLQWNPRYPASRAANWGGYAEQRDGGQVLSGTRSPFPSTPDDVNTRDYPWEVGRPYRFEIRRGPFGWLAVVNGAPIRELDAPGDRLLSPVVWSEVFARCDHPGVAVRWSGLEGVTLDGRRWAPPALRVTFPGSCRNTDVQVGGGVAVQRTACDRTTSDGAVLPL